MQVVSTDPNDQSVSVSYISNYSDLFPKFYLSYEKMQKDQKNDEKRVLKRLVNYYYSKVIDRWLYHDYGYRELTKYFTIKHDDEGISVRLIRSLDKITNVDYSTSESKSILFFIESFMINKKFIRKVIEEYAKRTSSKWFELYTYDYNIKEFIRHQLKKKIKNTITKMSKVSKDDQSDDD